MALKKEWLRSHWLLIPNLHPCFGGYSRVASVGTRIHQNIRIGIFKCLSRILFRMTLVSSRDSVKCNWPELFLPPGLSLYSRISGSPFSLESSFSGDYRSGFSFRILFLILFLSPPNLVYITFHEMGFSFRWGRSPLR